MTRMLEVQSELDARSVTAPHAFRVRNTFIDTSAERSPSLEPFYRERRVSTCPSSHMGRLRNALMELVADLDEEGCAFRREASPSSVVTCDTETTLLPGSPGLESEATCWSVFDGKSAEQARGQLDCALPHQRCTLTISLADALDQAESPDRVACSAHSAWAEPAPMNGPALTAFCGGCGDVTGAVPYLQATYFQATADDRHNYMLGFAERLPADGLAAKQEVLPQLKDGATVLSAASTQGLAPLLLMPCGDVSIAFPVPGCASQGAGWAAAPVCEALPSLGSAAHRAGQCKPCAFFDTSGCENGAACRFCHLCDAETRRQRRKDKKESRRQAWKVRGRVALA